MSLISMILFYGFRRLNIKEPINRITIVALVLSNFPDIKKLFVTFAVKGNVINAYIRLENFLSHLTKATQFKTQSKETFVVFATESSS